MGSPLSIRCEIREQAKVSIFSIFRCFIIAREGIQLCGTLPCRSSKAVGQVGLSICLPSV